MSRTISVGTCSCVLYIDYLFQTSGTASCGTTGSIKSHRKNYTQEPDLFLSRFCNLFFHCRVQTAFSRILIYWENPRALEAVSVRLIEETIISKSCSGLMPPPCMEICPETCFKAICGKWSFGSSEGAIWPGIFLQTEATDGLPGC